ncbi:MAG: GNAT family N-acetyltransferase [Chloroflexi bacterium]|nr:GNAT family N-acetyltransferase [Chloroflexota bacterium]
MRVREATAEDRTAWDSFVDAEGGSFSLYFDWKYVHEVEESQFIPLLVETAPSQLAGVLPIVKENHLLYSTLDSGRGGGAQGLLLKKGLSDGERGEAISALLEYVRTHCARRCSSFTLAEAPGSLDELSEEPTAALINGGFRFRYNRATHLPCNFVLPLGQPFEETVWKKWPRRHRQHITNAAKGGVVVFQDGELKYAEDFVLMANETIKRHGLRPLTRDELMARLEVFRERSKLFVALLDGRPVVTLLCHYTPSTCYMARVGTHDKDTNYANRVCYRAVIEDACNAGFRFADFGYTDTASLAFFKERFRGTRVPVRVYDKRYSLLRTIMQKAPALVGKAWQHVIHLRGKRSGLLERTRHDGGGDGGQ